MSQRYYNNNNNYDDQRPSIRTGVAISWIRNKGYGFVKIINGRGRQAEEEIIYVHKTELPQYLNDYLQIGERIRFDVVEEHKNSRRGINIRLRKDVECYYCGKTGHAQRFCRNKPNSYRSYSTNRNNNSRYNNSYSGTSRQTGNRNNNRYNNSYSGNNNNTYLGNNRRNNRNTRGGRSRRGGRNNRYSYYNTYS